ncbi:hypothetical protein Hsar01_02895 [Haloferula sargassicola]|uniref:Uncharacterized protein n=1 Tax=Haloferula sargassicola TaxID=490096 RepID=A0ABP9UTI5_9BACT
MASRTPRTHDRKERRACGRRPAEPAPSHHPRTTCQPTPRDQRPSTGVRCPWSVVERSGVPVAADLPSPPRPASPSHLSTYGSGLTSVVRCPLSKGAACLWPPSSEPASPQPPRTTRQPTARDPNTGVLGPWSNVLGLKRRGPWVAGASCMVLGASCEKERHLGLRPVLCPWSKVRGPKRKGIWACGLSVVLGPRSVVRGPKRKGIWACGLSVVSS